MRAEPSRLLSTLGSASARRRPWQVSCPYPPDGFSPWRMNTIVSVVVPVEVLVTAVDPKVAVARVAATWLLTATPA